MECGSFDGVVPMETSDDDDDGNLCCEPSLRDIILQRARRRRQVSTNPALLRLRHDCASLRSTRSVRLDLDLDSRQASDPWGVSVLIRPSEGLYSASMSGDDEFCYPFRILVNAEYPYEGPTVTSQMALYHPNVDLVSGRVGLEIIMCDWTPIMSLGGVLDALLSVMEDPILSGPSVMNAQAAEDARKNVSRLISTVQQQQVQFKLAEQNAKSFGELEMGDEDDEEKEQCGSCRKRRDEEICQEEGVEPEHRFKRLNHAVV